MKISLNDQIHTADQKAMEQVTDSSAVILFEENRCGNRMGRPGDSNNAYYTEWFEFYSYGPDRNPRSEGSALNIKDSITHKPVCGGNNVSEVDVIESFRKAHPDRNIVILSIEPFKGDLAEKMHGALMKYRETGQSLMVLPPLAGISKQNENCH